MAVTSQRAVPQKQPVRPERSHQIPGAIFQTTIDSEVIAYHVARERLNARTAEEAVKMP